MVIVQLKVALTHFLIRHSLAQIPTHNLWLERSTLNIMTYPATQSELIGILGLIHLLVMKLCQNYPELYEYFLWRFQSKSVYGLAVMALPDTYFFCGRGNGSAGVDFTKS